MERLFYSTISNKGSWHCTLIKLKKVFKKQKYSGQAHCEGDYCQISWCHPQQLSDLGCSHRGYLLQSLQRTMLLVPPSTCRGGQHEHHVQHLSELVPVAIHLSNVTHEVDSDYFWQMGQDTEDSTEDCLSRLILQRSAYMVSPDHSAWLPQWTVQVLLLLNHVSYSWLYSQATQLAAKSAGGSLHSWKANHQYLWIVAKHKCYRKTLIPYGLANWQ